MTQSPPSNRLAMLLWVAMAALLALAAADQAGAATATRLGATLSHPVGVTALKDKLLITQECSNEVMAMAPNGQVSTYATYPANPSCPDVEDYIAAVPQEARAPWQPNDAYLIVGSKIYRLDQRGRVSTLSSGLCATDIQASIAFDRWGTWGGGLIAQCGNLIYKVGPTGQATLVANIGVYGEGAQVIPPGSVLPQYTGWLIVAEEFANNGQVVVVSPSGSQQVVVGSWPDAEGVDFITHDPCALGTTGVFFAAMPTSALGFVLAYPRSDMNGLAGRFMVAGEDGTGLGVLNGVNDVTLFDSSDGETLEGATFFDWSRRCAS